jgi:hypothetical protein
MELKMTTLTNFRMFRISGSHLTGRELTYMSRRVRLSAGQGAIAGQEDQERNGPWDHYPRMFEGLFLQYLTESISVQSNKTKCLLFNLQVSIWRSAPAQHLKLGSPFQPPSTR